MEEVVNLMAHRVASCLTSATAATSAPGKKPTWYSLTPTILEVTKSNILYKCGWSPFEGNTFKSRIRGTRSTASKCTVACILTEHGNHAGERLAFNR